MCGRYAAGTDPATLIEVLEVEEDRRDEPAMTAQGPQEETLPWSPVWNMAPTKRAPVVLQRSPRDAPGPATRQLRLLTWGLVPSWAKDPSLGTRMINARAETLLEKRSYAKAAASRRCLVPATGWFEWAAPGTPAATWAGAREGRKAPYLMTRADGNPVVMAGIYEFWRSRELPGDQPSSWMTTYSVITRAAEEGLDRLHERMPVVLEAQDWAGWLDPQETSPEHVLSFLDERSPGRFSAHPVGPEVGNVRNSSRELVRPQGEDLLSDLR